MCGVGDGVGYRSARREALLDIKGRFPAGRDFQIIRLSRGKVFAQHAPVARLQGLGVNFDVFSATFPRTTTLPHHHTPIFPHPCSLLITATTGAPYVRCNATEDKRRSI
jgi:hypothetical protein